MAQCISVFNSSVRNAFKQSAFPGNWQTVLKRYVMPFNVPPAPPPKKTYNPENQSHQYLKNPNSGLFFFSIFFLFF